MSRIHKKNTHDEQDEEETVTETLPLHPGSSLDILKILLGIKKRSRAPFLNPENLGHLENPAPL